MERPGPDALAADFYTKLRDLIPIILICFKVIEKDAVFPNSFLETSIISIPKLENDPRK